MFIFVLFLALVVFMFLPCGILTVSLKYMDFSLNLQEYNKLFMMIVLVVSLFVLMFNKFYMSGYLYFLYLEKLMVVFVIVMLMLISSMKSLWMTLIFWDLLGVVSFVLVLFYMSRSSFVGAMSTVLSGRVGDFILFVLLGSSFSVNWLNLNILLLLLLCLVSLTKSAQFPFMGWLTRAMSAPTPVSSLVHSSTLVTAGLLLMISNSFLLSSSLISGFLLYMSLLSFLFSGVLSLLELDMKKLVALSTLSQISLCMLSLSLFLFSQSYNYMLMHALFKSLLFMQVGYMIYVSMGQQLMNKMTMKLNNMLLVLTFLSLVSLMGLLYVSSVEIKEVVVMQIMESEMSSVFLLLLMVSISSSYFYSLRILNSMDNLYNNSPMVYSHHSKVMEAISVLGVLLLFFGNYSLAFYSYNPVVFSNNSLLPLLLVSVVVSILVFSKFRSINITYMLTNNSYFMLLYPLVLYFPCTESLLTKSLSNTLQSLSYLSLIFNLIMSSNGSLFYISIIGSILILMM